MNFNPYTFLILPMVGLTGCTGYQNSFDCPPSPGVGCQSISEIHDQITEHPTSSDKMEVVSNVCHGNQCQNQKRLEKFSGESLEISYPIHGGTSESVHRVPERIIRIWVRGHVRSNGDYEGPHYVYSALKDDGWYALKRSGGLDED